MVSNEFPDMKILTVAERSYDFVMFEPFGRWLLKIDIIYFYLMCKNSAYLYEKYIQCLISFKIKKCWGKTRHLNRNLDKIAIYNL